MKPKPNKWNVRYGEALLRGKTTDHIAKVLTEYAHLLPQTGRALDLACGLGVNALFLAAKGLDTWAWDISSVAIQALQDAANERRLNVHAQVRDIVENPPEPSRFDVILVHHFLDRQIVPDLISALRLGGVLFYQTFTHTKIAPIGPRNESYLLNENELLKLFLPLQILAYREEGAVGNIQQGFRNEALLVARQRSTSNDNNG